MTEFALDEIVLGQATPKLGSCKLFHDMWMFSRVEIKLWVL